MVTVAAPTISLLPCVFSFYLLLQLGQASFQFEKLAVKSCYTPDKGRTTAHGSRRALLYSRYNRCPPYTESDLFSTRSRIALITLSRPGSVARTTKAGLKMPPHCQPTNL